MINIIQKPQLKIYRNGQYSRVETWKPVIDEQTRKVAIRAAQVIDRWFVEHKL